MKLVRDIWYELLDYVEKYVEKREEKQHRLNRLSFYKYRFSQHNLEPIGHVNMTKLFTRHLYIHPQIGL